MTLTSILIGLAAAVVLFFVQPLLLQAAASVSGEEPAGYLASFAALFAAAFANIIAGGLYGLTLGALIASGNTPHYTLTIILGTLAVTCATINVVGGYLVTDRMLAMFKTKAGDK